MNEGMKMFGLSYACLFFAFNNSVATDGVFTFIIVLRSIVVVYFFSRNL